MNELPGPPDRIAVIGLGNPLMGDDGFGLAALDRLESRWTVGGNVTLVDGGTWGLNLLPIIEAADRVLLLDAVRAGRTPGTRVAFEGDDVPRCFSTKLSPHQIDVREILALAELRGTLPATLVALGVEPETVELHDGLSAVVEAQLDGIADLAARYLRDWGGDAAASTRLVEAACTR